MRRLRFLLPAFATACAFASAPLAANAASTGSAASNAAPARSAQAAKPAPATSGAAGASAAPAISAAARACPGADLKPSAANASRVRAATLCLLNRERTKRGLHRLHAQASLRHAANSYARLMVQQRFFD